MIEDFRTTARSLAMDELSQVLFGLVPQGFERVSAKFWTDYTADQRELMAVVDRLSTNPRMTAPMIRDLAASFRSLKAIAKTAIDAADTQEGA